MNTVCMHVSQQYISNILTSPFYSAKIDVRYFLVLVSCFERCFCVWQEYISVIIEKVLFWVTDNDRLWTPNANVRHLIKRHKDKAIHMHAYREESIDEKWKYRQLFIIIVVFLDSLLYICMDLDYKGYMK